MDNNQKITGFRAFTLIWLGQLVSLIGTGMTRFALTIWAYNETGSVTVLSMVAFFSFAPTILLSPVAGALVDRWNRKLVMAISDLAAGMSTVGLLLLFASGNLQIWHLYVAGAWASTFEAFQFPAFSAAITMIVPKKAFARASAMLSLAQSASGIIAPVAAGFMLSVTTMNTILQIDIATFSFAVLMIVIVYIPTPRRSVDGAAAQGSLWQESIFGFKYIFSRSGLLGMQMVFFFVNLFSMATIVLMPPLILAVTDSDEAVLSIVQAAAGVGGVLGGVWLSAWGGPKRKVHGVFIGMILAGLFGQTLLGLGQSLVVWVIGSFFFMFFVPLINSSNQAIWQIKVPADVQGKVFGVRRLIAQITGPVAMILCGPLADRVFEPAMQPDGALAPVFGGLVGTGTGAGISLMFVFLGIMVAIVGLSAYAFPFIREIEVILPDIEVAEAPASYPDEAETASPGAATAPAR